MKKLNSLSELSFLKETMKESSEKINKSDIAVSVSSSAHKHKTVYYIDPYTKTLVTQTI